MFLKTRYSLSFFSMGHETVLATITLFGRPKATDLSDSFDALKLDDEYLFVENIDPKSGDGHTQTSDANYDVNDLTVFALLEFEKPVIISPKSNGMFICSVNGSCQR